MKIQRIARHGIVGVGLLAAHASARQDPPKQIAPQPEVKKHEPPKVDDGVKLIEVDEFRAQFGPDRSPQGGFSLQDQLDTYKKSPVETPQPWYLWGREMYASGPLKDYPNLLGDMNPTQPHLMVYGDWRTAAGFSDDIKQNGDSVELATLATRLNVDIDFKMTATERIHAFVRPFDKGGRIMSAEIGGEDGNDQDFVLDGNLDTIFFEGDAGPMFQGITGRRNDLDLPFTFGKIPMFIQNGVWVEDAFVGVAASIQARNSGKFEIANADFTFFAGFDDVSSAAVADAQKKGGQTVVEGGTKLVGVAAFIDTRDGYAELGAAITSANDVNAPDNDDADYLNLTAAWTKRYWHWLSNSVRVITNLGQDLEGADTADGTLLLIENSFGTPQPYTLIPYLNLFVGVNSPQALARAADAGGVLKNTGINFEADALTLHPKLDDTGHDAWGGAIGVEYLPNLFSAKHRQQIVLEFAGLHHFGDDRVADGDEFALGARYQFVINNAWIFRADVIVGQRDDDEISGFRVEIRRKF